MNLEQNKQLPLIRVLFIKFDKTKEVDCVIRTSKKTAYK